MINVNDEKIKEVIKNEFISEKKLNSLVKKGEVVITGNDLRKNVKPIGIGFALKTKINANLGSSPLKASAEEEVKKAQLSVEFGADTVMDLSTGGNIDEIRKLIIKSINVPIGTVPIYQATIKKNILDLTEKDFIDGIKKHVEDGVDFITVHTGITKAALPLIKKRLTGVVSRGGGIIEKWMKHNEKENPLFEAFDEIIEIALKRNCVLSLGDALRPGSIKDATDEAQLHELKILGKQVLESRNAGVQSMVEGPGHIPLNEIEKNMKLQKKYCHNAPFYVLGPLVTDIGAGYDHITAAIGGAVAGMHGASFLCYVTPAEHLGLPDLDDVKEGVIASKIAAHSADIAKGLPVTENQDDKMSYYRKKLNWKHQLEFMLNKEKAYKYIEKERLEGEVCTMCGHLCPMKDVETNEKNKKRN